MAEAPIIAVLDVGKTNLKLLVLDRRGAILDQAARANRSLPAPPYLQLDSEGVWRWLVAQLRVMAARWPIDTVVATTHGAAAALVEDDGRTGQGGLALPMLDYEAEPPAAIGAAYDAIAPGFAETFAPPFPAGLNLARQIFWQQEAFPDAFGRVRHILTYPQYLAWRLTGVAASEVTSLGAHTHLWAPQEQGFSSLVERLGWRSLWPPIRPAFDVLGPVTPAVARATGLCHHCLVLCGIHDSNAALLRHLRTRPAGFTLASTGTWVIVLRPGHGLSGLDPGRDMLANVDVTGRPIATARFMGGREHHNLTADRGTAPAPSAADLQRLIDRGTFALPSFAPAGPFPDRVGAICGPEPGSATEWAALATTYVALMTCQAFDLLSADGELIVDGGFAGNELYTGLLAALRPDQTVLVNRAREGTATGAGLLASWQDPAPPELDPLDQAAPAAVKGLAAYAREWRDRVGVP